MKYYAVIDIELPDPKDRVFYEAVYCYSKRNDGYYFIKFLMLLLLNKNFPWNCRTTETVVLERRLLQHSAVAAFFPF